MIKPDGVARGLIEEIFNRVEMTGLKVAERRQLSVTPELAAELYLPHLGKSFYPGLIQFITSGPVVAAVIEGENCITRLRTVMGATEPDKAAPGTIRGDLREENFRTPLGTIKNLVHGSDSNESAEREIKIFFGGER